MAPKVQDQGSSRVEDVARLNNTGLQLQRSTSGERGRYDTDEQTGQTSGSAGQGSVGSGATGGLGSGSGELASEPPGTPRTNTQYYSLQEPPVARTRAAAPSGLTSEELATQRAADIARVRQSASEYIDNGPTRGYQERVNYDTCETDPSGCVSGDWRATQAIDEQRSALVEAAAQQRTSGFIDDENEGVTRVSQSSFNVWDRSTWGKMFSKESATQAPAPVEERSRLVSGTVDESPYPRSADDRGVEPEPGPFPDFLSGIRNFFTGGTGGSQSSGSSADNRVSFEPPVYDPSSPFPRSADDGYIITETGNPFAGFTRAISNGWNWVTGGSGNQQPRNVIGTERVIEQQDTLYNPNRYYPGDTYYGVPISEGVTDDAIDPNATWSGDNLYYGIPVDEGLTDGQIDPNATVGDGIQYYQGVPIGAYNDDEYFSGSLNADPESSGQFPTEVDSAVSAPPESEGLLNGVPIDDAYDPYTNYSEPVDGGGFWDGSWLPDFGGDTILDVGDWFGGWGDGASIEPEIKFALPFSPSLYNQSLVASAFGAFLLKDK